MAQQALLESRDELKEREWTTCQQQMRGIRYSSQNTLRFKSVANPPSRKGQQIHCDDLRVINIRKAMIEQSASSLEQMRNCQTLKRKSIVHKNNDFATIIPKKISLVFQMQNRRSTVKEEMQGINKSIQCKLEAKLGHQIYINNCLTDYQEQSLQSKHKYLEKVQKQQQRKIMEKCRLLQAFGISIKHLKPVSNARIDALEAISDRNKEMPVEYEKDKRLTPTAYSKPQTEHIIIGNRRKKVYLTSSKQEEWQNPVKDRPWHSKLKKMNICLQIIMSTFGFFVAENQGRKEKLQYFVGNGNNRNLIRSVMKKRWWWQETKEIAVANLIWTQLKHVETIDRQKQVSLLSTASTKQTYSSVQHKLQQLSAKHIRILHPYDSRQLNSDRPKSSVQIFPQVIHNHFANSCMLGNKNALFHNLAKYCSFKSIDVNDILPVTYVVEGVPSSSFEEFERLTQGEKDSIWIVKPGEDSNRGNGIFLCRYNDIKRKIVKLTSKPKSYIIQKYLSKLMLYNGRKFDIRVYVLAISVMGVTKFFWYNEGYLRTSSEQYNLNDLDNLFVHLTNDAIQAQGNTYGLHEPGNKLTYNDLQRYLDANYLKMKYNVVTLVEQMKDVARLAIMATYAKINPVPKQTTFELFGMDFIVDSNFKPWLLEANTNPCLQLSPVLERLIPRMVQNMFRLAVDPLFSPTPCVPKNQAYYIYEDSLLSNRFKLIFDSRFDRDSEWQRVAEPNPSSYSQDSLLFENQGEMINFDY